MPFRPAHHINQDKCCLIAAGAQPTCSRHNAKCCIQSTMLPSATPFFTYQQLLQQAGEQGTSYLLVQRAAREQKQDPNLLMQTQV